MENQFINTGGKTGALAELSILVLPVRQRVLDTLLLGGHSAAKKQRLLARVGELTLWRAELDAHCRVLALADVACQHGQDGTIPDNWEQWGGGEAYDAHQEIVDALEWAPGRGEGLSQELLAFFDELPRTSSDTFADGMSQAVAIAPILSLSPENDYGAGLGEVTEREIGDHAHNIARDLLEKTMFLASYNEEVGHALALAKAGGDLAQIQQLIL